MPPISARATKARPKTGSRIVPSESISNDIRRVLLARSLRVSGDAYVSILLPVHLSRLGFDATAAQGRELVRLRNLLDGFQCRRLDP
jgi:hypothetical protein